MEINNFEGKKHVKILYIHPLKKKWPCNRYM